MISPASGWRDQVTRKTLRADVIAGLTGATVVLPQAVAFAAIAGLPPEYGLYTAMITPVVAAIFGSSMVMISGPTTAISALVYGALAGTFTPGSELYIQHVLLMTVLVGIMQLALALAQLGRLVAFVSSSVMLGFTSAAAVLIAASQLGDFFGLRTSGGGSVIDRLARTIAGLDETNWRAIAIASTALAVAALIRTVSPRAPNFIIALVCAGGVGYALDGAAHGIETVGALPSIVPSFAAPQIDMATLGSMVEAAFAVALIGLLEAISIGRAFAYRTGRSFDANQEIFGQGMSNLVGGLLQAYPGSGSFTRSGLNHEAGAKTPLSAIFSSIFLFVLLLFLAPLVAHIPLPALAGLILYVAWRLIHFAEILAIIKTDGNETAIFGATFVAGTLVGLEFAIYVGVIISLMIFLGKSSRPQLAISAPDKDGVFYNAQIYDLPECPQIVFARLDGPLYFGSAEAVERAFKRIARTRPDQKHMILMLKGVGDLDLAGANVLVAEAERRRRSGGTLYIVARFPPFVQRLRKLNVIAALGEQYLFANKGEAIEAVTQRLDAKPCELCTHRVFKECMERPDGRAAAEREKRMQERHPV